MTDKTISFLVSGNGGTLKFLYSAIQLLDIPFKINTVISDRECGAYEFAVKHNIKAKVINYTKNNDTELTKLLENTKTDIIITNIHKILTPAVLKSTNADFINLHYSLLPAFAGLIGMKTVNEARKKNCKFIGATCHEVTEELDGGKILAQGCYSVDWAENNDVIYNDVFRIACITFLNGLLSKYGLAKKIKINQNKYIFNPLCFDLSAFNEQFWNQIKAY